MASWVRTTTTPLKKPHSEGETERQDDAAARSSPRTRWRVKRGDDAAGADDRADREIELAGDHQQRDGDGEDAELGGHFEDRSPCPAQETKPRSQARMAKTIQTMMAPKSGARSPAAAASDAPARELLAARRLRIARGSRARLCSTWCLRPVASSVAGCGVMGDRLLRDDVRCSLHRAACTPNCDPSACRPPTESMTRSALSCGDEAGARHDDRVGDRVEIRRRRGSGARSADTPAGTAAESMAKSMSPSTIACSTSGERSKVASLIVPSWPMRLERRQRRRGAGRAEGEDAVDLRIGAQRRLDAPAAPRSGRPDSTATTLQPCHPTWSGRR